MTHETLLLDGSPLTLDQVEAVARHGMPVALHDSTVRRLTAGRNHVETVAGGAEAVYGVNTGFGSLSRVRIPPADVRALQRNLIRSHAAGVGEPLPRDVVRAMLLLLAGSLSRGHSGVRVEVIKRILDMLNHDMTPIVPSRGSVGASGDLAPLSHAVLALIGEGDVWYEGRRRSAAEAWREIGTTPVELEAKEGLALINGTHLMAGCGALLCADIGRLFRAALLTAAMAIDACRATDSFLDPRVHALRCQPGQMHVAQVLRDHLKGSTILPSHAINDPRVQDPYCLRAMPQVLGAAWDGFCAARAVFERELGAVTDNPLVFPREDGCDFVSAGNFHGMPLALAFDTLKIALCHVAGISERRVYWLLKAEDSENPVNAYLSPQPGLHSGLMIVQYTAAACCNEMQTLATPASVANIPTSAGVEDYNSMGATSAHQTYASVQLARSVIAIELLVMCEAMEYQRPLRSGPAVERAYDVVRERIPPLTEDRPPAPDIAVIESLISAGALDGVDGLDG
jgi:histidine ammonia-lyase